MKLPKQPDGIEACRLNPAKVTDEFDYPAHVLEALDFIERETALQERRERQATCSHDNIMRAEDSTFGDPAPRELAWCADCWLGVDDIEPPRS